MDDISPQILKDLTAKPNAQTGLNFLKALTNLLVKVILEGKVRFELRSYFFGAKLIALKNPEGGLRRIAVGNTFRWLSAKCAGYHVFESRQARYGSRQVGVGAKKGAEMASHVFRCLIESPQPKESVILKIDFENAKFISTHTRRTVNQVSFFGDSVIKSFEGTQQGDPESPALFSDSIQDLI